MKIPIKILIGNIPDLDPGVNWGDVIDNWEAYAVNWEASGFGSGQSQAPILDMFGDESVSLKEMVKNISDPKKLFTDFSRTFTVPASKKNNRIFKHYYNIDIANGLDSRELIPAKILLNNATYKTGNIMVEGVRMSKGVPLHYKIKFFGKLSELAKNIGQDKLSSLNWTEYDINDFDGAAALSNTIHQDIVFPVASRNKRFVYDSNSALVPYENTVNISPNSIGDPGIDAAEFTTDGFGITEDLLVGAMRLQTIIDKISEHYGITFSGILRDSVSNGFESEDYIANLYLWLHQTDQERVGESYKATISGISSFSVSGTGASDFSLNGDHIIYAGNPGPGFDWNSDNTNGFWRYKMSYRAIFSGNGRVRMYVNGEEVGEIDQSNTFTNWILLDRHILDQVITFEADMSNSTSVSLLVEIQPERLIFGRFRESGTKSTFTGSGTVGTAETFLVKNNMPKTKIMDILVTLFKMFNLVAEVDDNLNVHTTHYNGYMSLGTVKDFTEYVGNESYDVNRPNIYSALHMEFADPKLALEQAYLTVNGRQYGEMHYEITSQNGNRLSGGEYMVKIDSQRTPVEPLYDIDGGASTTIQYTQFGDLKGAEQTVKPMFTYVGAVEDGDNLVYRSGSTNTLFGSYLIPTNSANDYNITPNTNYTNLQGDYFTNVSTYTPKLPNKDNMVLGLYFGEELNEYDTTSSAPGLGLWNCFYKGVTKLMFEEDKRRVNFKARIPQGELIKLKLSDILYISNNYYNIESIETNYLTGESKLSLILVGASRLEDFRGRFAAITNNSTTETLRIVYNSPGALKSFNIGPGGTFSTSVVGNLVYASHDDYDIVDV
jgi:hypothetical protein